MRFLLIDENLFTGSFPSNHGNLSNLEVFRAPQNYFSGPIPNWINNATKLSIVDLSGNLLEGTISEDIFTLNYLRECKISYCLI